MDVAIVGGGIAGMSAALYLSKAGHKITLFDRDAASIPARVEDAFEWERRGVPQVRHSHAMLARLRNLLHQDHPEVLAGLLDAGATEMKIYEDMPAPDGVSSVTEDDREIVMLACRRATLDWVLRNTLQGIEEISIRSSEEVTGVQAGEAGVIGVTLADGSLFPADIVVAADGRRSRVPRWLDDLGIELEPGIEEPAGIVYFSRFYKLKAGCTFPTTGLVANDLGYLFYAAFCGDSDYFSIALSANEDDAVLRDAIKTPELFQAAAAKLPELSPWLECGTPVSEVYPMSGLINRRRHFIKDGAPVLPGFHVIGDAHICTNPAYGRGLSLAVWQARLLANAIAAHPADLHQQCCAFSAAMEENIVPWFDISLLMDGMRRAERDRLAMEGDAHAAADNPMKSLAEAASVDPEVWRTFWRVMNLLSPPDVLMSVAFLERVSEVSGQVGPLENDSDVELPKRSQMLDFLTTAGMQQWNTG